MFRGGNVYARFCDIFDEPAEEPNAVFSPDGKIEFVKIDDGPKPKPPEVRRERKKPIGHLSKKVAAFLVLCVLVFILIIFTFTNFIILLQDRARISANSEDIKGLPAELAIKPKQIDAAVQNALSKWTEDDIPRLKDELEIKPEVLDSKIDAALSKLSADVMQRLGVAVDLVPQRVDERIEKFLTNLSESVVQRLKDELEISPLQLEDGIKRALSNMSSKALGMLRGVCQVSYEGRCFWAVKSGLIQFGQAASICHSNGAEAANIYNEQHYQKMLTYLRKRMPPLKTVWLGMTRNVTGGVNHLENGDITNYTMPWYPGYPRNVRWDVNIGIHFEVDINATHQGFFNDSPNSRRHGILCEL